MQGLSSRLQWKCRLTWQNGWVGKRQLQFGCRWCCGSVGRERGFGVKLGVHAGWPIESAHTADPPWGWTQRGSRSWRYKTLHENIIIQLYCTQCPIHLARQQTWNSTYRTSWLCKKAQTCNCFKSHTLPLPHTHTHTHAWLMSYPLKEKPMTHDCTY